MGCEPPRGASGDFVIIDFGWRLVHVMIMVGVLKLGW
jgi:hypothetical protein